MAPQPEFMKLAVEEGVKAVNSGEGGPFGAIIMKDGKVLVAGHNMIHAQQDCTAHAEMTVIRMACQKLKNFDLTGCTMYTSCYPCPMCMGACLWAHLEAVYYGASKEEAHDFGFSDQVFHEFVQKPDGKHKDIKQEWGRFTVDNYLAPFKTWDAKEDKVKY